MRGYSRPSSISSYKIGGGRSQEAKGGRETVPPSLWVERKAGRKPGAGCWEQETAKSGAFPCTHPPSSSLSNLQSQPGEREGPMSKSTPLLSPSWSEVDNLQGNNKQGPSPNWEREQRESTPPTFIPHPSAHDELHGYVTRLRRGFNPGKVTIATSLSPGTDGGAVCSVLCPNPISTLELATAPILKMGKMRPGLLNCGDPLTQVWPKPRDHPLDLLDPASQGARLPYRHFG